MGGRERESSDAPRLVNQAYLLKITNGADTTAYPLTLSQVLWHVHTTFTYMHNYVHNYRPTYIHTYMDMQTKLIPLH